MNNSDKINVLYYWEDPSEFEKWKKAFKDKTSNINLVDQNSHDARNAEVALVWLPPKGFLKNYKNLKGVINFGQGVDHLMQPDVVPDNLPIIRLVDHDMSRLIAGWVSMHIFNEVNNFKIYKEQEKIKLWKPLPLKSSSKWKIGVLGLGAIGSFVAKTLALYGYEIRGWSKTQKSYPEIICLSGNDGLAEILSNSNIIICLLPLTKETKYIINEISMKKMPKGATIINAGRGSHVNENDLLKMINSGHIKNAYLDVFETEPLPKEHPFWTNENISIWPHVAGQTNEETAIDQIINAIYCFKNNQIPPNCIDRKKGY